MTAMTAVPTATAATVASSDRSNHSDRDDRGSESAPRPTTHAATPAGADAPLGGGALAGLSLIARSRYLQGLALHLLLLTVAATFLYMEQGRIVAAHFADTAGRTRYFALLDLAVSALTLLLQLAVTGRLMRRFGVVPALVALPASAALAFGLVALWPGVAALAVAQTLRRAAEYALARPAREVLWTVAGREAKYKAKSVVDTVVYRGGDAFAGWLAAGLAALGAGFAALALATVPLAAAWAALGVWLGRRQDERLARRPGAADAPPVAGTAAGRGAAAGAVSGGGTAAAAAPEGGVAAGAAPDGSMAAAAARDGKSHADAQSGAQARADSAAPAAGAAAAAPARTATDPRPRAGADDPAGARTASDPSTAPPPTPPAPPPRLPPPLSDRRMTTTDPPPDSPARARWLRLVAAGAFGAALPAWPQASAPRGATPTRHGPAINMTPATTPPAAAVPAMHTRPIPSSGEALPVVGCGTWVGFDVDPGSEAYARLPGVLDALFAAGGSVVDSSPMYGRAEATVGALLAASGERAKAFLATKVWTEGREEGVRQMQASMQRLGSERIDLMQVHNLVDWRTHLRTLREWKEAGRVRYVGVTHYHAGAYPQLAAVLRSEVLDFVQLNHSIEERSAEDRLLPLAAERGVAVIANMPFGGSGAGLLRRLAGRPLPGWAAEIGAASWAQLLLKFALANPAVTCVIPGTGNPRHMADNAAAGAGPLPGREFWNDKLGPLGF